MAVTASAHAADDALRLEDRVVVLAPVRAALVGIFQQATVRTAIRDGFVRVLQVVGRRLFPERVELQRLWADHYGIRLPTGMLPRARAHRAKYAA